MLNPEPVQPADTWHRTGWVLQDPGTIIKVGCLHVSQGRITEIKSGPPVGSDPVVDHGPGVLMPSLINAHTHLELGQLKEKLPLLKGFMPWVRQLIEARAKLDEKTILMGVQSGIDELIQSGCGAAAEIATLGLSKIPFLESALGGIWFKEYLGSRQEATLEDSSKPGISLAGHAPHTTSPDLLIRLKAATNQYNKPFHIHLSESEEEDVFIRSGLGPWAELMQERQIDFSAWPLPAESPVEYLKQLNILDEKTVAVHLLTAVQRDLKTLAQHGVSVVVCPRSNRSLHRRLPDIPGMVSAGLNVCLGTDSLASCDSLSIFDEMAAISKLYGHLDPESILAMATINGARALGIGFDFGRLVPGYCFSAVYVPLTADKPKAILEKIVNTNTEMEVRRLHNGL